MFKASDIDKDKQLNKMEYRCFYSPEDYPEMKPLIINGIMNRYDKNEDRKITFEEYVGKRCKNITFYKVCLFYK